MRSLFAFLMALASVGIHASEINISYSTANNLILKAKSCEDLLTEHKAICQWKKQLDPKFVIPKIDPTSCQKISNTQYSTTVSTCLPEFVKAHQNKKLFKDGANCWGTAMHFKKVSVRPRFIWSHEIRYWQDSPLCRKLNPGEKKLPGDIINTYGPEYIFKETVGSKGDLFWDALYPGRVAEQNVSQGYSGYHNFLHSETFVSDKITFGKLSPNKLDRFEFHPMREVYGRSRDVDCQENQTLSPHYREYQNAPKKIKDTKCDYFSLAYRCENVEDYFARQVLNNEDRELIDSINKLKAIQDKLFPLVTEINKTIPKSEIAQMLKISDQEAHDTLLSLGRGGFNKNTEMLLTLKYFTAAGIRKSLELAGLTPATESL